MRLGGRSGACAGVEEGRKEFDVLRMESVKCHCKGLDTIVFLLIRHVIIFEIDRYKSITGASA